MSIYCMRVQVSSHHPVRFVLYLSIYIRPSLPLLLLLLLLLLSRLSLSIFRSSCLMVSINLLRSLPS